jgi:hypothetical protein
MVSPIKLHVYVDQITFSGGFHIVPVKMKQCDNTVARATDSWSGRHKHVPMETVTRMVFPVDLP